MGIVLNLRRRQHTSSELHPLACLLFVVLVAGAFAYGTHWLIQHSSNLLGELFKDPNDPTRWHFS